MSCCLRSHDRPYSFMRRYIMSLTCEKAGPLSPACQGEAFKKRQKNRNPSIWLPSRNQVHFPTSSSLFSKIPLWLSPTQPTALRAEHRGCSTNDLKVQKNRTACPNRGDTYRKLNWHSVMRATSGRCPARVNRIAIKVLPLVLTGRSLILRVTVGIRNISPIPWALEHLVPS